jgi:pimeloyl-ACP methyl ester carboxylesterase
MPYINVNDIQMYYEELGRGLPLILLHGGTGAIDGDLGWNALRKSLAEYYRAIFIEYRGHGRTNNPNDRLTYEQIADDVAAFLGRLDIAPAHIAGMGDGGIVALLLGIHRPELVRSLVCVGANHTIDERIKSAIKRVTAEAMEEGEPDRLAELARLHDSHRWPGYWKVVVKQVVNNVWISPQLAPDDLRRVARPTLIIAGDNDPYGNLDQMPLMKRNIPQAELLIVNNAGHSVQHTHAGIVGPALLEFLKRQQGRTESAKV